MDDDDDSTSENKRPRTRGQAKGTTKEIGPVGRRRRKRSLTPASRFRSLAEICEAVGQEDKLQELQQKFDQWQFDCLSKSDRSELGPQVLRVVLGDDILQRLREEGSSLRIDWQSFFGPTPKQAITRSRRIHHWLYSLKNRKVTKDLLDQMPQYELEFECEIEENVEDPEELARGYAICSAALQRMETEYPGESDIDILLRVVKFVQEEAEKMP